MKSKICIIYSFLNAAKGNWRNSIYIECHSCPYGKQDLCSGFMFVPNSSGRPILISADVITAMTGTSVDKDECIVAISRQKFEILCALWLERQINSPNKCALLQIVNRNQYCHTDKKEIPCCRNNLINTHETHK